MTFFPILPSANENSEQEPNPILEPLYLYLSKSAFLVSITYQKKQLSNLKSVNICVLLAIDLVCKCILI